MNTMHKYLVRISVLAGSVVILLLAPLLLQTLSGTHLGVGAVISDAQAAQGAGGAQQAGQGGAGAGQAGGQGQKGAGSQAAPGSKRDISTILEVDEDSDRPAWAGGDKEENPQRGEGNLEPGDRMGDEYADLWLFVRDPVTGVPVTVPCEPAGTCYQVVVCADEACTNTEIFLLSTDPEAELPAGVVAIEVDLGRLNLGRAPVSVIEHAEDEAISKITAEDAVLTLDEAGRIVVNGATIDSPLENLALYIALITGDSEVLSALEPLWTSTGQDEEAPFDSYLELAASLLGSAADKTGEITTDVVFYSNVIYELVPEQKDYVDYDKLDYDRSLYDTVVSYYYLPNPEDPATVLQAEVNLLDYLQATYPVENLDDAEGITLFAIAANDALQIVELIHTQIHTAALPGTVAGTTSVVQQ